MVKEVDLNKQVAYWINGFGRAYKRIATPGRAGEPDVSGCVFGIRVELEGKLPGNKPTPLQFKKLEWWKQAGAITGWYTSLREAQQIVINGLIQHAEGIDEERKKIILKTCNRLKEKI